MRVLVCSTSKKLLQGSKKSLSAEAPQKSGGPLLYFSQFLSCQANTSTKEALHTSLWSSIDNIDYNKNRVRALAQQNTKKGRYTIVQTTKSYKFTPLLYCLANGFFYAAMAAIAAYTTVYLSGSPLKWLKLRVCPWILQRYRVPADVLCAVSNMNRRLMRIL